MRQGCRHGVLALAGAAYVAALLALLSVAAGAAADDLYTVSRVPVDVTAESSVEARERALTEAMQEALDQLIERLSAEGRQLPPINRSRVEDLVLGIDIDGEKVSAVRYIADVTVHFNPNAFRAGYGGYGQPGYPAVAGRPIIVLPIYEWAGTLSLWDELNPWYAAWTRRSAALSGAPLQVPRPEPTNMTILSPEQAQSGDRDRIGALGGRFNAVGAIVAGAEYVADASGRPALELSVTGYGQAAGSALTDRIVGRPGEPIDSLAERGVTRIIERIGAPATAQAGTDGMAGGQNLAVRVALSGPGDLMRIKRQIGGVPAVMREELVSLSRNAAVLRLQYNGDLERLRAGLLENGLTLSEEANGWRLLPAAEQGVEPFPAIPPAATDRR